MNTVLHRNCTATLHSLSEEAAFVVATDQISFFERLKEMMGEGQLPPMTINLTDAKFAFDEVRGEPNIFGLWSAKLQYCA